MQQAHKNLSHQSHGRKKTGKKESRLRRPQVVHEVVRVNCNEAEPIVKHVFPCKCVIEARSDMPTSKGLTEFYIVLPEKPKTGERRRFLGRLDTADTLHIFRNGLHYFRVRQGYAIDQHLLHMAHETGAFHKIHCETPSRGGVLAPDVAELLRRKPFRYHGLDAQVLFKINEIQKAEVA